MNLTSTNGVQDEAYGKGDLRGIGQKISFWPSNQML